MTVPFQVWSAFKIRGIKKDEKILVSEWPAVGFKEVYINKSISKYLL